LIEARSAPEIAALLPSAKRSLRVRKENATTVRMPSSSAASTAQIAVTEATCVTTGCARPGRLTEFVAP